MGRRGGEDGRVLDGLSGGIERIVDAGEGGQGLVALRVVGVEQGDPLLRLDLPRVLGASAAEESLHRALEAAEAPAPVALWVDEIEKGFAGSSPADGADARAARLLGAFSTWLQERRGPVFVVATANDVSRLPPELLRRGRFDELFFVDLPDPEARREILGLHLRRRGRDPSQVDVDAIADLCGDFSGAELEQVVVGALHRAYALGRELETGDLRRVAQDVVPLFVTYEEQIKALREWARGRARVFLSADTDETVYPGEILVAPFTDPGWTPLFARASAVVVEIGGLFSHAATVAREYGLPAVSNVEGVTDLLHDGDLVRVDGTRGVVEVVSRASSR